VGAGTEGGRESRRSFYREAVFKRSAQEGTAKLGEAVAAGSKRDYAAAVAILEEIVSGYEGPAEALLYLGRALHAQENHSRALAAFNDYIALEPKRAEGYFFAGRTCLVLGFYPRAVRYLEEALKRDRGAAVMALLGTALLKARRSRQAVEVLQAAVEKAPENPRIYRAYLNALFIRAIRVSRGENYDLALQMFRFVLDNGRDGPLLRLELGRASRERGLLEEAAEHYTRALEFAPGDPMIRWHRASINMERGRKIDAIDDIAAIRSQSGGELPELPWDSELVDRFLIKSLLEEGLWRRAADACRDWLKKRGAEPEIHAMYAEAQRNLRNYTAAENHLRRALEADGENLSLWYGLTLTAWEGRNLKTLKKALYTAKKLGGDGDILSRFSILYESEHSEDPRRVLSLLQKAVHTLGPEPELMYALGKAYLGAGLLEAAESWFSRTIVLRDRHEEAHLGLIAAREALFNEGPPDRPPGRAGTGPDTAELLAAAYRDYLDRWPDNRAIRRDEALFLVKTCAYEAAATKLEALLAWDPANPGLRRVLAYSFRKLGNYRSAAVYLRALVRERPRDIGLLLEYSGCVERAGGGRYARMILEKAAAHFSSSAEVPTALGLLFYREGNLERAFDQLREAASRNKKDPRPWKWMYHIARKKGDRGGAERYRREYRRILENSGKTLAKERKMS
jgi:tetratricopeptide (TPR) repeat protein